jgi:hypothetical protein
LLLSFLEKAALRCGEKRSIQNIVERRKELWYSERNIVVKGVFEKI